MKFWVPSAVILWVATAAVAQDATPTSSAPSLIVPVIRYTAAIPAADTAVSVKIAFYSEQTGGESLWQESQRLTPDATGKTSLLIGAGTEGGIPAKVFANGDARFVGITVNEGVEQPRSLIAPGAYAFKAADAQTLGGHPVSDFALKGTPETGTNITQINVGSGITGGGTGPTVTLGLNTSYLQSIGDSRYVVSVTGTNGVTATRSGTGVSLSLNDSTLQSLGNSLYAQLAGNNNFSGTNTFRNAVTVSANEGNSTPVFSVTNTNTTASSVALYGYGAGAGVDGIGSNTSNSAGVIGMAPVYGVYGDSTNTGSGYGVYGAGVVGVQGSSASSQSAAAGVYASYSGAGAGSGVYSVMGGASGISGHSYNGAAVWADTNLAFGTNGGAESALLATAVNNYGAVVENNSSSSYAAIYASAEGKGDGIQSYTNDTSTNAAGVYGQGPNGVYGYGTIGTYGYTNSTSGTGAYGYAAGPSAAGVEGFNTNASGLGAFGYLVGISPEGTAYGAYGAGVWGDTNQSGATLDVGLLGTADDNNAGYFVNNSSTYTTISVNNNGTGPKGAAVPVFTASGRDGSCGFDGKGSATCTGEVKTAVSTGGKQVEMYAVHSTENWFEDFGTGQLSNGSAKVTIDPTFAGAVNAGAGYHVFLTPNGNSKGLYVTNRTATSFEVREQGDGGSSISFDYRIVAKRSGHESERMADASATVRSFHDRRTELVESHAIKPLVRPVPAQRSDSPRPGGTPARIQRPVPPPVSVPAPRTLAEARPQASGK